MGSITHVAEDGEVRNRYEYDAWGNLTVCEEQAPNCFLFNGQQYDPISQQYYLHNPVNYVDPSGHVAMVCAEARERMRSAIDAERKIQDMDAPAANRLREWYENKKSHGWLSEDEKELARWIGLDEIYGIDYWFI